MYTLVFYPHSILQRYLLTSVHLKTGEPHVTRRRAGASSSERSALVESACTTLSLYQFATHNNLDSTVILYLVYCYYFYGLHP